jgi:hypothetical protein
MLVAGGYTHSLKLLLEKSRVEEEALASGRLRSSVRRLFRIDSIVGWMSEMWQWRRRRQLSLDLMEFVRAGRRR